jgi:hypothetical protein
VVRRLSHNPRLRRGAQLRTADTEFAVHLSRNLSASFDDDRDDGDIPLQLRVETFSPDRKGNSLPEFIIVL